MITILLYRLSFVQLGAALRKKTQPIEIYGLSGKITAFLGPFFVALLTTTFNNQKAGFVSIIVFFILGYLIIRNLKLPNYSTSK